MSRLTFKKVFGEIQSITFGFDSRFLRTMRDLFIKPGYVVKEYIKGNRIRYMSPVGYYFLLITISLLMFPLLGMDMMDYSLEINKTWGLEAPDKSKKEIYEFLNFYMVNIKYFLFLLVPIVALLLKLFFSKSPFNVIENHVFSLFVLAQGSLIGIINLPVNKLFNINLINIVFFLSTIYFVWAVVAVYKRNSIWKSAAKGFLLYVFSYFSLFIFVLIIMVGFVLINR